MTTVPTPEQHPAGDPTWRDDIEHCEHHQHDELCGGAYGECDWDYGADHCVCCECCCTCLGCEYGPRDGMLLNPPPREAASDA